MRNTKLRQIVRDFSKARILVLGDLILDEYIWGDVERISPEAPVPVVWSKSRSFMPGGAANVANNIRSLGANVMLVGIVGKDENSSILTQGLKKRKISTSGVFSQEKRYTTVKTRIIAGHQQVVRVDWENTEPIPKSLNTKIYNFIYKNINNYQAIVIEDYGKGVINADLISKVISLVKDKNKIITVDPKEEHFQLYRGVTSITPNRRELENAVRNLKIKDTANRFPLNSDRLETDKDINFTAREILRYLGLDSLLVTLGESGMRLFEKGGKVTHIPTQAQEVFDVSGAGDTVISAFTLSLACRAATLEAAHLANFAAGIVVGKVGVATTTQKDLLKIIKSG